MRRLLIVALVGLEALTFAAIAATARPLVAAPARYVAHAGVAHALVTAERVAFARAHAIIGRLHRVSG
ncbi:MAG: hypothetical protein ABI346_07755 [Candidatus Baltobacteraceae bacterium]